MPLMNATAVPKNAPTKANSNTNTIVISTEKEKKLLVF